jgi:D-sedoheptulose 7-phosphate isomerase
VKNIVRRAFDDLAASLAEAGSRDSIVVSAAEMIARSLTGGGVIYICGNGGSAAEAQHFAAEFVGRFLTERSGLPAMSLSTDTSKLTAIGNDYGFEEVFRRQIKALGRPGDVLWGISTSGTSPNVVNALEAAKAGGLGTIFMCGRKKPALPFVDVLLDAPAPDTPRMQELHLLYGHAICALVDHVIIEGGGRS